MGLSTGQEISFRRRANFEDRADTPIRPYSERVFVGADRRIRPLVAHFPIFDS
jgi:hypothetical protein